MITPVIENVGKTVKRVSDFIRGNIQSISVIIGKVLGVAIGTFMGIWSVVKFVFQAIAEAVRGVIQGIIKWFAELKNNADENFGGILQVVKTVFSTIVGVVFAVFETVKSVFQAIWEVVSGVVGVIAGLFGKLGDEADDKFGGILDTVKEIFSLMLDFILNNIAFIINGFIDMANFIAGVFKDPLGAAVDFFSGFVDKVLSLIEPLLGAISSIAKFFGIDFANPITKAREALQTKTEEFLEGRGYDRMFERLDPAAMKENIIEGFQRGQKIGNDMADRFADAFNVGMDVGKDIGDKFKDAFEQFGGFDPASFDGLGFGNYATSDGSLKVKQQGAIEIKGEFVKMMEDVSRQRFLGGAYQNKSLVSNSSSITMNVSQQPGENSEAFAKRVANMAADEVGNRMDRVFDGRLT